MKELYQLMPSILLYMLPALGSAMVVLFLVAIRLFVVSRKETEYKSDKYRQELELQIAELSKQLIINYERFRQVNHLLLSSQSKTQNDPMTDSHIRPNEFLQKMGVSPNIDVQNDLIFVLMPFNPVFNNIYSVISEVVTDAKFRCSRGDVEMFSGDILPNIVRFIVQARLIIAEITGRNPNVFYEMGIAHALGKQVLIISQVAKDIPFDVASIRVLTYEDEEDLRRNLRNWIVHTFARMS